MARIDKEFDAKMMVNFTAILDGIDEFATEHPDRNGLDGDDTWTNEFLREFRSDLTALMNKWGVDA